MKNNNELVIKAQDGDIHSFEILVDEFRDMAIGYAYSVLKDYHHAEDVAQESFVQAYFKLKTLQSPEAFPSWFRKIVFSQCEHFYRKKRLPVIPLDDVLEFRNQEQSPLEIVERRELNSRIFTAVKGIPEKERTITVLFYISGYSMAEIGKFLDIPISTIKNRLFSARKKLQKEMVDIMGVTFKGQKPGKEFNEKVKNMIASGYRHALVVKDDETVMTWGNLSRYTEPQTANDNAKPAVVNGLKNVKSIAAASGHYHSFALLDDGTVWGWGDNVLYHIGTGSNEKYITTPEKVKNLDNIVSISAGVFHTLALKKDGTVWAWGKNWYGQLGNGTNEESDFPIEISSLNKIKQISTGFFHSLALAEDGTVWRWGGYGDSTFSFPIVYASNTPVQIENLSKVISISAGGMHSALLCEDGTVWSCGYNTQKQLGTNQVYNEVRCAPVKVNNLSEVKAVSAGGGFTLALKADGTVWAWGANEHGELGDGTYETKSEPVEVDMLQNVTGISAGGSHAMAVTSDDCIWTWGNNDEGQLGDFNDSKRCVPQRITKF